MIRHRSGAPSYDNGKDDSSSSEEEAFSAFSRKKKKEGKVQGKNLTASSHSSRGDSTAKVTLTDTSSNKRHHHQGIERKSKMDALLQELQETQIPGQTSHKNKIPEKLGSYCLPGEENSTTNIFVGNLSPLTTEEQLTEIFRQFGDLYSVKIMWPRTPEEQARGRNTGFVCFMNRSDAQDAMDALQDSDPLNNGRKMFLNWGKNVKKVVKRGVGGVPIAPIRGNTRNADEMSKIDPNSSTPSHTKSGSDLECVTLDTQQKDEIYNPDLHAASAVRVIPPTDPSRFKFISTVAMFVAKDGSSLEDKLIEKEGHDPKFSFLMDVNDEVNRTDSEQTKNERIFYRWRVFSFSQGDTYGSWRTDPFIMVQPGGNFWIPPDPDPELLAQMKKENEMNEEQMKLLKQQRRSVMVAKRGYRPTRNNVDKSKVNSSDGSIMLSSEQLDQWEHMIQNLCASREVICEAMAFCFDNSIAAHHICKLLKTILTDNRPGVSLETKCARLYLLSDILFNSQQPGVKNAFRYRDAIEEMAPEVFKALGQHGNGGAGRLSMNKLRVAVRNVLAAWNSWSVYSDVYLDRLEAIFEGKPVSESEEEEQLSVNSSPQPVNEESNNDLSAGPSSIWMACSNVVPQSMKSQSNKVSEESKIAQDADGETDGQSFNDGEIDPSTLIDEELDGDSLGDSELEDITWYDS